MSQAGAVFVIGETYLRMKDSGVIYPIHKEQKKAVKKDLADFVECTGEENGEYTFKVVRAIDEKEEKEEPVKISTPARKPEVKTVSTPSVVKVDATATPPPKVDLNLE